jgi:hypothetical protein
MRPILNDVSHGVAQLPPSTLWSSWCRGYKAGRTLGGEKLAISKEIGESWLHTDVAKAVYLELVTIVERYNRRDIPAAASASTQSYRGGPGGQASIAADAMHGSGQQASGGDLEERAAAEAAGIAQLTHFLQICIGHLGANPNASKVDSVLNTLSLGIARLAHQAGMRTDPLATLSDVAVYSFFLPAVIQNDDLAGKLLALLQRAFAEFELLPPWELWLAPQAWLPLPGAVGRAWELLGPPLQEAEMEVEAEMVGESEAEMEAEEDGVAEEGETGSAEDESMGDSGSAGEGMADID